MFQKFQTFFSLMWLSEATLLFINFYRRRKYPLHSIFNFQEVLNDVAKLHVSKN